MGYLVRNGLGSNVLVSVLLGAVGGAIGASIVGWVLLKVILPVGAFSTRQIFDFPEP